VRFRILFLLLIGCGILGCVKFEGITDLNKKWLPPEIVSLIEIDKLDHRAGKGSESFCLFSFKKETDVEENLINSDFIESDKSDTQFVLNLADNLFPKSLEMDPNLYKVYRTGNGNIDVYLLIGTDKKKGFIYYLIH